MKEIKKSASIKSKVKGKETPFNVDLNYSEEYDSFNIKVKKGEGFMSYTDSLQGLPLEVVQKLNEMLEEVLIKAGSETEMKEHKMLNGGDFQSGVYDKGGSLIGNQKSIDLNHNGKIDAEDFKLLRTTMNGAWRNEHEHVNSTSRKDGKVIDYEVNYARKFNPSRKGYKGKTNFSTGGGVDRFSEYSNDALYDMIINLSRYENTESEIKMVKEELEKRKANKKMATGGGIGIEEEIDLTDDKKLRLRKPVMPERKYSEREWAEKFNPRAYEFMGKRKMATGGSIKMLDGKMYEKVKFSNGIEDWYRADLLHRVNFYCSQNGLNPNNQKDFEKALENVSKKSFSTGGGISKFKMLSDKVAKNYEGKRVKPQYQKEYGKVYSKSEAKEVGDKVAGKVKAMQKAESGTMVKKGARGGIMNLAKKIRKEGESWQDAVKRAGQQLK